MEFTLFAKFIVEKLEEAYAYHFESPFLTLLHDIWTNNTTGRSYLGLSLVFRIIGKLPNADGSMSSFPDLTVPYALAPADGGRHSGQYMLDLAIGAFDRVLGPFLPKGRCLLDYISIICSDTASNAKGVYKCALVTATERDKVRESRRGRGEGNDDGDVDGGGSDGGGDGDGVEAIEFGLDQALLLVDVVEGSNEIQFVEDDSACVEKKRMYLEDCKMHVLSLILLYALGIIEYVVCLHLSCTPSVPQTPLL